MGHVLEVGELSAIGYENMTDDTLGKSKIAPII